jgi:ferredoxin
MQVWIDTDECMGAGTCEQIAPQVFTSTGDGVWTVKEDARYFGATRTMPSGAPARVPDDLVDAVLDAAEQCPGECIFVQP